MGLRVVGAQGSWGPRAELRAGFQPCRGFPRVGVDIRRPS